VRVFGVQELKLSETKRRSPKNSAEAIVGSLEGNFRYWAGPGYSVVGAVIVRMGTKGGKKRIENRAEEKTYSPIGREESTSES